VAVALIPDKKKVAVRDTKNPGGPVLIFSTLDWGAFLADIKQQN
jgi:hypothetical protein